MTYWDAHNYYIHNKEEIPRYQKESVVMYSYEEIDEIQCMNF
jgi:hypothetical protein